MPRKVMCTITVVMCSGHGLVLSLENPPFPLHPADALLLYTVVPYLVSKGFDVVRLFFTSPPDQPPSPPPFPPLL